MVRLYYALARLAKAGDHTQNPPLRVDECYRDFPIVSTLRSSSFARRVGHVRGLQQEGERDKESNRQTERSDLLD